LYYTGGHPACVAKISESFKNSNLPCNDFFQENKNEIKIIINEAINNIYEDLPADKNGLEEILKNLSIFRFVDNDILDWFIQESKLTEFNSGYSLSRTLTGTYLYNRDGRFTSDGICRKLAAIKFRNNDKDQFSIFCKKLRKIHEEKIKISQNSEKHIIEYIFQYLQEQAPFIESKDKRLALKNGLNKKVNEILKIYVSRENASELEDDKETLLREIGNDWEFCYTLNYYLRKSQYNDTPQEELEQQINDFFTGFNK
jgi:hypothetical protein